MKKLLATILSVVAACDESTDGPEEKDTGAVQEMQASDFFVKAVDRAETTEYIICRKRDDCFFSANWPVVLK